MLNNKIQRLNEDIQRVLSARLREIKDPRVKQGMISVLAVDTASDLRTAKVFLSVMGLEDEKRFLKGLASASGYLRREIGETLSIRHTPELSFKLDKSIERGAQVIEMLQELDVGEVSDADDMAKRQ